MHQITRMLNLNRDVEGSVARSGNHNPVTVQLIQARNDKHVWAATFERNISDVLSVQGELARIIAEQVNATLTPSEQATLAKSKHVNPLAYEAYLKGRYESNQLTQDALDRGLTYYRQAIEIDPSYAPAYAGLAYYYLAQSDWALAPKEAMPRAKEALLNAIRLDDSLAEAHTELAVVDFWYDWNWPAAEREFRRAIELAPNSAMAHQYFGTSLVWAGDAEQGIAEGNKSVSLDPVSIEAKRILGDDFYFAHRYDEAIAQFRDCIQIEPNYWFAHLSLGRAYAAKADWARAQFELETAAHLEPANPEPLGALGRVLAQSGSANKARELLRKLEAYASQGFVSPYQFAIIYAGLGDKRRAIASLQTTCADKSIYATWMKTDPALASLQGERQFEALLSGLP